MTTDEERDAIKKRMTDGSFNACQVILESKYTGLRAFLNGGNITVDNLNSVRQALARLEASKAE